MAGCRLCGRSLRHPNARFCGSACKHRWHYLELHPGARRYGRRGPGWRPPRGARDPEAPVPCLEDHPLIREARLALRPSERAEIGAAMDSGPRDLIGEYVLAALEGRDPRAAVDAYRGARARDRLALVWGLALVDGLER